MYLDVMLLSRIQFDLIYLTLCALYLFLAVREVEQRPRALEAGQVVT